MSKHFLTIALTAFLLTACTNGFLNSFGEEDDFGKTEGDIIGQNDVKENLAQALYDYSGSCAGQRSYNYLETELFVDMKNRQVSQVQIYIFSSGTFTINVQTYYGATVLDYKIKFASFVQRQFHGDWVIKNNSDFILSNFGRVNVHGINLRFYPSLEFAGIPTDAVPFLEKERTNLSDFIPNEDRCSSQVTEEHLFNQFINKQRYIFKDGGYNKYLQKVHPDEADTTIMRLIGPITDRDANDFCQQNRNLDGCNRRARYYLNPNRTYVLKDYDTGVILDSGTWVSFERGVLVKSLSSGALDRIFISSGQTDLFDQSTETNWRIYKE